jgi:hypothetical protein
LSPSGFFFRFPSPPHLTTISSSTRTQLSTNRRGEEMNASQFMDKQILGLAASASPSGGGGGGAGGGGGVDLSDLMIPIPQEDGEDRLRRRRSSSSVNGTADDMLPSYDFQPIRTGGGAAAAPAPQASWGSLDSKEPSAFTAASYNLKVWPPRFSGRW